MLISFMVLFPKHIKGCKNERSSNYSCFRSVHLVKLINVSASAKFFSTKPDIYVRAYSDYVKYKKHVLMHVL